MSKQSKKQKKDSTNDMAGPETDQTNPGYTIPLPVEGAPVYFGGAAFIEQHRHGFSHEETRHAQELALHSFASASAGEGRVQDWQAGIPLRNLQGFTTELDNISTSAIISDLNFGNKKRSGARSTNPLQMQKKGAVTSRLMRKLNRESK